jgi:hypothetical protein
VNELIIKGPKVERAKLAEFVQRVNPVSKDGKIMNNAVKEVRKFSFDKVVPYPQRFHDYDEKIRNMTPEEKEECSKKHGGYIPDAYNSGGYEWCCKHWGTKWDLWEDNCTRQEGVRSLHFYFDTAWSPPIPVIEALAKKFPKLKFIHKYWERGMGVKCREEYVNGEKILEESGSYNGNKGG